MASEPVIGAVVHVAANGDDAQPGTAAAPVATLERARDLLRKEPTGGERRMLVEAGTYYLARPLELGGLDGGLEISAAEGARPVLSGGRPISGWTRAEGDLWKAPAPADALEAALMRAGNDLQVLARTPDFEPENPIKGGWHFMAKAAKGLGEFGPGIGGTHTVGDWLEWEVNAPAAGHYTLWMRYAASNQQYFDAEGMRHRMQMQVNGGAPIPLEDVPDTANWDDLQWNRTGALDLAEGKNTVRWTNVHGGGLNWDAFALARDPEWSPKGIETGAPVPDGVVVVQAEAFARQQVKELYAAPLKYPAFKDHFPFREGDVQDYPASPHPRIHVFPAWGWVNAILDLDRVDAAARTAWIKPGNSASEELRPGNRYFIANIREGLDAPGEWWLDTKAREVLWYPRDPQAVSQPAVLATMDRLITIKGAEGVHIHGFEFRDTAYSLGVGLYAPDDAAIHLANSRKCVIENNRFYGIGGYALKIVEQAAGNEFVGNEVDLAGQGGVILEAWDAGQQPVDNLIAGNYFHRLGQVYKHVAAVYCTTAHGTVITHNRIEDVPRYAISFKGYGPGAGSHRNIAEFNEINRTNLETNDTGAIECLGRDKEDSGNIIRYNRIENTIGLKVNEEGVIETPFMTWSVYLDDYSSGVTILGNLLAGSEWGGVAIHGGRNNLIENNFMVDGRLRQLWIQPIDDYSEGNRIVRNIFLYHVPEADWITLGGGGEIRTPAQINREIDHNLLWNPQGAAFLESVRKLTPLGNFRGWQKAGFDEHSVLADPGFENPAAGDYRLKPDSAARGLGIQDLPWEKMGLRGYERSWKGK